MKLRENAIECCDRHIRLHPCIEKQPIFQCWPDRATDEFLVVDRWLRRGTRSLGMVCDPDTVACVDVDSAADVDWWLNHMPKTPWMTCTPRGGRHFQYQSVEGLRNAVKCKVGRATIDVRAGGKGYAMLAGSECRHKIYELLGQITLDLPPFDPEWLPKREHQRQREIEIDSFRRITRARAYGKTVFALSGSGGHNTTFRFVCWMRDLGLTPTEAYSVLLEWNETNADPKWSNRDLSHKIESAYEKAKR